MNERLEEQRRETESLKQLIGIKPVEAFGSSPWPVGERSVGENHNPALTRGLNSRNGASQSLPIPAAGVMEKDIGPGVVQ